MFHRGEPLTETVWEKLMLGRSTRRYGQAVREFTEAYGLEKSAISEHFIEASRRKLQEIMERRLDKLKLCALLVDAKSSAQDDVFPPSVPASKNSLPIPNAGRRASALTPWPKPTGAARTELTSLVGPTRCRASDFRQSRQ
jgi:hypothetical protein